MLTQSRAEKQTDPATDFSVSHILRYVSHELLAATESMPYLNTMSDPNSVRSRNLYVSTGLTQTNYFTIDYVLPEEIMV